MTNESKVDNFTALLPEYAKEAAYQLRTAFTWCESREGHDYWHDIYNRLVALGATDES